RRHGLRRAARGPRRRRREDRGAAGPRQGTHRAVQVPPPGRLRDRSAQDVDGQAAALQAPPGAPRRADARAVNIGVIGGGAGGLYSSALAKQLGPEHEITVWERTASDDTFGFGVVFSDETLGGIEHADPEIHAAMEREFARWDDIDVHFRDRVITSGGHGFAAISRRRLLKILQQRCDALGVEMYFRTEAPEPTTLSAGYDLVLAADGANSVTRAAFAGAFGPAVELRQCKYIWLSTDLVFDAFKFYIVQTPYGVIQVHGYPYDATGSPFIVEMPEKVWQSAGFAAIAPASLPPGRSDEASIERIGGLLGHILRGHAIEANNSKWVSFGTLRCRSWRHRNVVLLGD